jgi:5-methylcytosine-specific restriction protein B
MTRNSEHDSSAIFIAACEWRDRCLAGGKSLIWSERDVWTETNLAQFKKHFIDRPDTAKDKNFDQKFKEQLTKADEDVTRLACELLFVYFLFPSSVGRSRKTGLIREVAAWKGIRIEEQLPLFSCFDDGIGDPGLVYNTGRPNELTYLARFAIEILGNRKPNVPLC